MKKMKKKKERATDFGYSDLPHNRKEVFFDVVKQRWKTLLILGLILLLGFLPLLIVTFLRDNYALSTVARFKAGEIDESTKNVLGLKGYFYASLWCIPCFWFLGLAICGTIRILRQLVWGEPLFFKEDFITGIKNSYGHYFISTTIFGLVLVLDRWLMLSLNNSIIAFIPLAVFAAAMVPPMVYELYESSIYGGNYIRLSKNAFLMYIKEFPRTLLFDGLLFAPLLLSLITSFLVLKYGLILMAIVFVLPFSLLIATDFRMYCFDRFINKTSFPDLVGKGIFNSKAAEDEIKKE